MDKKEKSFAYFVTCVGGGFPTILVEMPALLAGLLGLEAGSAGVLGFVLLVLGHAVFAARWGVERVGVLALVELLLAFLDVAGTDTRSRSAGPSGLV